MSTSSFNMNQYLDSRQIIQKPGQPLQLSTQGSSHQRPLFIQQKNTLSLNPAIQSHLNSSSTSTSSCSSGFEPTQLCSN
jgi:hypothetical protein